MGIFLALTRTLLSASAKEEEVNKIYTNPNAQIPGSGNKEGANRDAAGEVGGGSAALRKQRLGGERVSEIEAAD